MPNITKDAILSECGKYRYLLTREWGAGPTAVWIMLNPSTADAFEDDPTIRRIISFSQENGCGRAEVVNLFALRSTDPSVLIDDDDAVGPLNAHYIAERLEGDRVVICAWGSNKAAEAQGAALTKVLSEYGEELLCLGTTASGAPKHPLYIKGGTPLTPYGRTDENH